MTTEVLIALLSLVGTLVGTFGGILISNKLTVYRIGQLEVKVDRLTDMNERIYVLEGQVKELQHEVIDIKKGVISNGSN